MRSKVSRIQNLMVQIAFIQPKNLPELGGPTFIDWVMVPAGRWVFLSRYKCPVFLCRGPRPGGLCPGSTGRGQLTRLPATVRPDPAERGPSPGPPLSARLQEPAEPPDPGGELQPRAVPTAGRVSQTPLTSRLDIELQNLCLGLSREDRLIKSFRNGCERCCQNSQILCFPSRSESALDRLVQVLEILITGELNMNQAAPGKSKLSDPYQRWLGLNWITSCSVLDQFFLPQCRC